MHQVRIVTKDMTITGLSGYKVTLVTKEITDVTMQNDKVGGSVTKPKVYLTL